VDFEERLAALWASLDDHSEEEFMAKMDELLAELPPNSAVAAYERGSALTG
jgi:hypothetical protein